MKEITQDIVIVGGGFAGITAARDLAKKIPTGKTIALISNKSYFEYYPGLYRLVTGASPIEVCVPLSDLIPDTVTIVEETVTGFDPENKKITCMSGATYQGEYVVLALGSQTAYFNIPGLEEHAFGFKSLDEALRLKQHIHDLFETQSHTTEDKSVCVGRFHIVIVGGGASGVEIAGDLASFTRDLSKKYNIEQSLVNIDIIESAPRIVANLDPRASFKIQKRLRALGVNIYLNRTLVKEEVETVYLKDMSIQAQTLIWTAGTRVNPFYASIPAFPENKKGRILVDHLLQVKEMENIFIAGDAADTPRAGLAQTAVYDGAYVANVITQKIQNRTPQAYKPNTVAYVIPVGPRWGILAMNTWSIVGIIPYIIRHAIDFMFFIRMVSFKKFVAMYTEGFKYRSLQNIKK